MYHQRRQHTIYFAKTFERPKKSCRVFQFPKQVQSYQRNGKRLRPERRRYKYKDPYKEEKQQHEKALQRYQEDHMDEMEIINLHKGCNKKAKKVSQPKKASPKSDEPKKVSEPIGDPSEEGQKLKKADEKKTTTKAGKKVKKPHSLRKHRSPQSLLIQTQMTQTMNKDLSQNSFKKHKKLLSLLIQTRVINKSLA